MNTADHFFSKLISDLSEIQSQVALLAIIIVVGILMLDAFSSSASRKKKEAGFPKDSETVSIDGSRTMAVREYISEIQGLAGKPDALILEAGNIIPVERKPLAKKVRDRYIAQLLVYMRLVEEFEGKKPPYGYLILGPQCRKVKIYNSDEKQAWLSSLLDEMREIALGKATVPTPQIKKCSGCEVKNYCSFRIKSQTKIV